MKPPNTPGFGGYLLALLVGSVVFGVLCEVTGTEPGIWMPAAAVAGVLLLSLYTAGIPLLVLAMLAVVVHLTIRPAVDQRLHVLAAFAVPFLGLLPFWFALHLDRGLGVVLLTLPTSMALGRAAVIPLVTSRRGLALGAPLRVP